MADEFKSFYKTVGGGEGLKCLYPTRLDVYGCGCQHDCAYCYAKSLLDFRGLWSVSQPRVANVDKVVRKIKRLNAGDTVRLGGMTDCFAPIERKHGVAKMALRKLCEQGVHSLIVTKSDLIADDSYIACMDPNLVHVQVSVTSTSDEPNMLREKASPISKRIEAIEKLESLGFDVSVRLSPYVPQLVDKDVVNNIRCSKLLIEFLRVNHWTEKWLDGLDLSDYTLKEGGYRHLPLDKKIELVEGFKFEQVSVCEDVAEHYLYWKRKVNHNPDDCCNIGRNKCR